jgi:hypothetical protein
MVIGKLLPGMTEASHTGSKENKRLVNYKVNLDVCVVFGIVSVAGELKMVVMTR